MQQPLRETLPLDPIKGAATENRSSKFRFGHGMLPSALVAAIDCARPLPWRTKTYGSAPNRDAVDAGSRPGMRTTGGDPGGPGCARHRDPRRALGTGAAHLPAAAGAMGQRDAELSSGPAADRDGFRQPDRRHHLRHVADPGECARPPWGAQ